ncbi:hypothetical protein [Luteimonas saliphila]|uniref:hypothetical protein n=1 Tax=Luteimonas saliphila TaxID=2804919 RepID=UPI00192DFC27|nr:hypothetical protein [Luteimonas saliphila]
MVAPVRGTHFLPCTGIAFIQIKAGTGTGAKFGNRSLPASDSMAREGRISLAEAYRIRAD